MKIISNDECYIQGKDLDYILYNNNLVSEIYDKLITCENELLDKSEYIKLEDQNLINYIMSHSEIPDFEDLYNMNTHTLKKKMSTLLDELLDESYNEDVIYLCESEKLKKQKYIEYIKDQLEEMIAFKEKKSKIVYPSVPLPDGKSLTNGTHIAIESMKTGEVLVYSLTDSSKELIDNEFLKIAYSILTDIEQISIEDLNIEKINSKYTSLKQLDTYKKDFSRVLR